MNRLLIGTSVAIIFAVSQMVIAADQAEKAETAESKAKVLEQNAAAGGSKTMPSQAETITKSETQAVDPVGEEPLDEAIICLSRTIYWETPERGAREHGSSGQCCHESAREEGLSKYNLWRCQAR